MPPDDPLVLGQIRVNLREKKGKLLPLQGESPY
jgi:hypothetical protein